MDELEPANVGYLTPLCCSKSWLNSKSQTPPPAICKTMQKPVSFAEFSRNEREKIWLLVMKHGPGRALFLRQGISSRPPLPLSQ